MTRRFAFVFVHVFVVLSLRAVASAGPVCDASLWDHVFSRTRLTVVEPCVVLRGVVVMPIPQFDGDYHILVKPDPGYEWVEPAQPLVNAEVMCVVPVMQDGPPAQTCAHWHQDIAVPAPGAHVEIAGAYVDDGGHGWHELHPVTSIEAL